MQVVVMGVTGVGKSTVGRLLAEDIGARFVDADDFHPPANVGKMRAGIALDDNDRAPWLAALNALLTDAARRGESLVLACSALKGRYRQTLRAGVADFRLIHLGGSPALIAERLGSRVGHYMNPALLESQLGALEVPADAIDLDIGPAPQELARAACAALRRADAAASASASAASESASAASASAAAASASAASTSNRLTGCAS